MASNALLPLALSLLLSMALALPVTQEESMQELAKEVELHPFTNDGWVTAEELPQPETRATAMETAEAAGNTENPNDILKEIDKDFRKLLKAVQEQNPNNGLTNEMVSVLTKMWDAFVGHKIATPAAEGVTYFPKVQVTENPFDIMKRLTSNFRRYMKALKKQNPGNKLSDIAFSIMDTVIGYLEGATEEDLVMVAAEANPKDFVKRLLNDYRDLMTTLKQLSPNNEQLGEALDALDGLFGLYTKIINGQGMLQTVHASDWSQFLGHDDTGLIFDGDTPDWNQFLNGGTSSERAKAENFLSLITDLLSGLGEGNSDDKTNSPYSGLLSNILGMLLKGLMAGTGQAEVASFDITKVSEKTNFLSLITDLLSGLGEGNSDDKTNSPYSGLLSNILGMLLKGLMAGTGQAEVASFDISKLSEKTNFFNLITTLLGGLGGGTSDMDTFAGKQSDFDAGEIFRLLADDITNGRLPGFQAEVSSELLDYPPASRDSFEPFHQQVEAKGHSNRYNPMTFNPFNAQNEAANAQHYQLAPYDCLDKLYVMAFTTGDRHAGSDTRHNISITTRRGETKCLKLPNLPGNDYFANKGDLWRLSLDDFKFRSETCLTRRDIDSIAIVANGIDGWMVDSVVTFVCSSYTQQQHCQLATQDLDVYAWVDGNGSRDSRKLTLTLFL